jgi:hypothetical protein
MALLNETGRVVIRFGLGADGEEGWEWETEDISTFEAWAGVKLVADYLHGQLMNGMGAADDDEDPDP